MEVTDRLLDVLGYRPGERLPERPLLRWGLHANVLLAAGEPLLAAQLLGAELLVVGELSLLYGRYRLDAVRIL